MTETILYLQLVLAVSLIGVFSLLYRLGGFIDKVYRRYVAGILFPLGCIGIALLSGVFSWWMTLALLAYPAVLSIGYGADILLEKILRRFLYGFLLGNCSGLFLIPMGLYSEWVLQIILATSASVWFGITNPSSATSEEGLIGLFSVCIVPFMLIR